MRGTACIMVAAALLALSARAEEAGPPVAPEVPDATAAEISRAQLPPFKLDPKGPVYSLASSTQVVRRAQTLGLNFDSAVDLAKRSGDLIERLRSLVPEPAVERELSFDGDSLAEIEPLLSEGVTLRVRSRRLLVDRPIVIQSSRVTLDLGRATLEPSPEWRKTTEAGESRPVIVVKEAERVYVEGGRFEGLEAVLFLGARQSAVSGLIVRRAPGYAVVVGPGSAQIAVVDSRLLGGVGSGVVVMEQTEDVLIANNEVADGQGGRNRHAGILVTDRRKYQEIGGPDFLLDPRLAPGAASRFRSLTDPIVERLQPPRRVVLLGNEIRNNLANGIYLEGAVQTYVGANRMSGNSKEGICLDNGSTANVVANNEIVGNGRRWGKSDRDLELDFVAVYGRMSDGAAKAKLPGVSIDNAAFNLVADNHVAENFGGGVKMVRTSFYNAVGFNVISNNNRGANDAFFFFGVELGGAVADAPSAELDFLPSQGNMVFQNLIFGEHHAGVQFCPQCDFNDIFGNVIQQPTHWSIEQTSPSGRNSFFANFSQWPARNADLSGRSGRWLLNGENRRD